MHHDRRQLEPNTTLYPVPVVLVTAGADPEANVFTLNRIASCNVEPPMLGISIRPARASHDIIRDTGEFVVNIPWPEMEPISDFVGSTTIRETDKWAETGLIRLPASEVQAPLLAECPVNLECRVRHQLALPSHTLFIADVVAMHAHVDVLNEQNQVDFERARRGLAYRAAAVRERPVDSFRPADLRRQVNQWRDSKG